MSKDKKTWVEFRKKIEDDINWAGLKEQLDDSGKKKDTHFDKLRKVKDQINKQKEKIGKIDVTDPKQRTPHAIATADLKSMNLKLKDMQVTDNEPETDDKGKPSKKKYIKEEPLVEGLQLAKLVGKSIAHLEMYVELANDVKKIPIGDISSWLKTKAQQASQSVPPVIKELRRPGIWNEQVEKVFKAVKFWEAKQNEDHDCEKVHPNKSHKEWLMSQSPVEGLEEALRDMEDYREKSKTLQSIQNDPKQMRDPQMKAAVMKRKFTLSKELSDLQAKQARQRPIAAELEPDTIKKEETDRQIIEEEIQMDKKYLKTRRGSVEDSITKIRVEQPTVKIEKPKITLQAKSYFDQKEGSLADAAAKLVSEESNVKYKVVDAKTKKPISDKSLSYNAALHMKKQKGDGYEVKSVDAFGKVVNEKVIKEDDRLINILKIKKAIEIAKKMSGDMTGATKEIEKLAKGLSKEKDVSTALLQANEEIKIEARSPEEQKKQDKMMKDFLAKGGKVKKLKPGIAKGAGYLDHRGEYKKDMLAASAVYKAPTAKYKKTTLAAQKSFKNLRSETDQKEVEKDLVASKHGGKGKTLTGKIPAVIDTEPKVNPI